MQTNANRPPTLQFFSGRQTKTHKIQNIYQDIFQLVDPVSTTKVYKNEVVNLQNWYSCNWRDDNIEAHMDRVARQWGI